MDGAGAGFGGAAFAGAVFAGTALVAAPDPFLGTGLGDAGFRLVAEVGFGTALGVPDGAGGLLLVGVPDFGPSGRDERES